MDSFELNKIIGAILGTLLFIMGIGFLAEAIYEPAVGSGPGYALPEPSADTTTTAAAGQPAVSIGTLLASADPKQGEASAKKCQACHDFTKGGPNKTGPNLYDIIGSKIADVPGFAFSDALKAHEADTWTYENMNQWLISPKAWAPGTKMTFAGIKDDTERANVIAFLSTLSESPKPFPAPEAAAPAAASSEAPAASSEAAPAASSAAPAASSEAPVAASSAAASSEAPAATSSAAPASSEAASSEAPASSEAAPAASSAAPSAAPASELSSAAQ